MCTYVLLFYLSAFQALLYHKILTGKPNALGKSGFSVIHSLLGCWGEQLLFKSCHNMEHISQYITKELNVSVCF